MALSHATSVTVSSASVSDGRPKVAVFRGLRGLGDFLVAVPALRALRQALPNSTIGLIGVDCIEPLAARFAGLFDEFIPFPGWPGIPERSDDTDGTVLDSWRYADIVVQMHGDGAVSNGFCASLRPKNVVTYGLINASGGCTVHTAAYLRRAPELERCLDVAVRAVDVVGAGMDELDRRLEFPLTDHDRSEAATVVSQATRSMRGIYYVLHPGAYLADRRWPVERFGEVGRELARHGSVLVTGSASESALARETAALIGERAESIAGCLTVGGLGAVLSGAAGVVTNDTGVSHLADAVEAPSVVVFTASDAHRWAPLDTSLHAAVRVPALDGEPAHVTPGGDRLADPSAATVLDAACHIFSFDMEHTCISH